MTEKKPRSSFLPIMLLIVGVVVVAGVVVAFVPLIDCEGCLGVGSATAAEWEGVLGVAEDDGISMGPITCDVCSGGGSTTLLVTIAEEPDAVMSSFLFVWEEIRRNRQSTP